MIIPQCYREEVAKLEDKINDGYGTEADELRLQEIWRDITMHNNMGA